MTDLWRAFVALSHVTAFLILGSSALAQPIPQDGHPDVLVGAGPGSGLARLLSGVDGSELASGARSAGFTGGVRVASGDVNGDGSPDIVTATGPGGGRVRVFDGAAAAEIATFTPFGPDSPAACMSPRVTSTATAGPNLSPAPAPASGLVRVFSGATRTELASGAPFGLAYTGGVTVATGDMNGDGQVDVIAGMAIGGLVRAFNGATIPEIASGFPYGATSWVASTSPPATWTVTAAPRSSPARRIAPSGCRVFDAAGACFPASCRIPRAVRRHAWRSATWTATACRRRDGRRPWQRAPRAAFSGADGLELMSGLVFPGIPRRRVRDHDGERRTQRPLHQRRTPRPSPPATAGTFTVTTAGRHRRADAARHGHAAGRRHVHRQRQRHRDAGRDSRGRHRRHFMR